MREGGNHGLEDQRQGPGGGGGGGGTHCHHRDIRDCTQYWGECTGGIEDTN